MSRKKHNKKMVEQMIQLTNRIFRKSFIFLPLVIGNHISEEKQQKGSIGFSYHKTITIYLVL
jgi:hypothetical protein